MRQDLGGFDHIVVAHNGKCADRLMKTAETPEVHRSLVCSFGDRATPADKMQLSSLWVLVFRVQGSLPVDFEGAHIEASPVLSWAANNTKKMNQPGGTDTEAWTLISTRAFGKKHKCPQEARQYALPSSIPSL